MGWDVKTNKSCRSTPPKLDQLQYMLGKCRANVEGYLEKLHENVDPTAEVRSLAKRARREQIQ